VYDVEYQDNCGGCQMRKSRISDDWDVRDARRFGYKRCQKINQRI
jgi:hypothetical protein